MEQHELKVNWMKQEGRESYMDLTVAKIAQDHEAEKNGNTTVIHTD